MPFDFIDNRAVKCLSKCSGWVYPGELVLLVADNFELSQKLLYSLAGLCTQPASGAGAITYAGSTTRPKRWMSIIGFVEEEDHLVGKLTVEEHVMRKAQLQFPLSAASEVADCILTEFNLREAKGHRVLKYGEAGALSLKTRNRLKLGTPAPC